MYTWPEEERGFQPYMSKQINIEQGAELYFRQGWEQTFRWRLRWSH